MTSAPKKKRKLFGMAFDEALARLLQTDKKELEDTVDQVRREEAEAERYVEERRESIRKGARRAPKRFRL